MEDSLKKHRAFGELFKTIVKQDDASLSSLSFSHHSRDSPPAQTGQSEIDKQLSQLRNHLMDVKLKAESECRSNRELNGTTTRILEFDNARTSSEKQLDSIFAALKQCEENVEKLTKSVESIQSRDISVFIHEVLDEKFDSWLESKFEFLNQTIKNEVAHQVNLFHQSVDGDHNVAKAVSPTYPPTSTVVPQPSVLKSPEERFQAYKHRQSILRNDFVQESKNSKFGTHSSYINTNARGQEKTTHQSTRHTRSIHVKQSEGISKKVMHAIRQMIKDTKGLDPAYRYMHIMKSVYDGFEDVQQEGVFDALGEKVRELLYDDCAVSK